MHTCRHKFLNSDTLIRNLEFFTSDNFTVSIHPIGLDYITHDKSRLYLWETVKLCDDTTIFGSRHLRCRPRPDFGLSGF